MGQIRKRREKTPSKKGTLNSREKLINAVECYTQLKAINKWLGHMAECARETWYWGMGNITEHGLLTCCWVLFRQCHQCIASTRLIINQAFGRHIANDLIPFRRLHLHCDILQNLIIQGVCAIKLHGEESEVTV